ncbi:33471_t:CDS:2, partial [Gigaspora margarita]
DIRYQKLKRTAHQKKLNGNRAEVDAEISEEEWQGAISNTKKNSAPGIS